MPPRSLLRRLILVLTSVVSALRPAPAQVVYEGAAGPGQGKHIVLLAGDHEYRSEETLPALARILAQHHGIRCSV